MNTRMWTFAARLWEYRYRLLLGGLFGGFLGLIFILATSPLYTASVSIFPKEVESSPRDALLAVGGLGGLNPFQSSTLNRMQVMLRGDSLTRNVITAESLLPELFPNEWDAEKEAWKKSPPNMRRAVEKLQNRIAISLDMRSSILEISVEAGDPRQAERILRAFLKALNDRIRNNVFSDLEENRRFLETRLHAESDPLLRDKIQTLIALQLERAVYLNATAFDVPEMPRASDDPTSPNRLLLLVSGVFGGLFFAGTLILGIPALRALYGRLVAERTR